MRRSGQLFAIWLAAASAAWSNGAAAQEFIVDGSFDAPSCLIDSTQCPPWSFTHGMAAATTLAPHSGVQSALLQAFGAIVPLTFSTVSQSVSLSKAGLYGFSFFYSVLPQALAGHAGPGQFTASVGGQNVLNLSVNAATPFTQSSTQVTLSSGTQNVLFSLAATTLGPSSDVAVDDVSLIFLRSSLFLSPLLSPGAPINPTNVAAGIDSFINAGGTLPAGFLGLFNLTPQQLSLALTQASGEVATSSQQTTFSAMGMFMGLLTDPFIAGRSGGAVGGVGATPFADEGSPASSHAANRSSDAYAMFTKARPAAPFEPRWSVWAAGFGGSQTTDGNAAVGSNTTTSRIAGTAVGADYRFSPFTIAGFALAGGGTNFSVANALGSGRSDLFQAGAYVYHALGAAYVSGALAYGWQDITTNRIVTIAGLDELRAQFNANAFSGRAEGGYRFISPWMGGIGLTPYGAAQFTTFDLPAYAEQAVAGANGFALAYGSRSVTDTRSEFGLRSDKSYALADGVLTLRGRVAWAHDFDPDRNIGATFQALPGASFVVNGAAQASDSALVTASVEKKWLNGWSAAATFEGEFSSVTTSYAGKGVVRYTW
jgi:hypothetical protein